jgi:Universal stress protein family
VEGEHQITDALKANDAVLHLRHHGIDAVKYRAIGEEDDTADVLIAECRSLGANLLVMGSYGHSRLHELLPGSTTSRMLRRSPFPPAYRALVRMRLLRFLSICGQRLTVVKVTPWVAS